MGVIERQGLGYQGTVSLSIDEFGFEGYFIVFSAKNIVTRRNSRLKVRAFAERIIIDAQTEVNEREGNEVLVGVVGNGSAI